MASLSFGSKSWQPKLRNIAWKQVRNLHLHEYQSQQMLKDVGISVPRGEIARTPLEAAQIVKTFGRNCFIRPQILNRGRQTPDIRFLSDARVVSTEKNGELLASELLGNGLGSQRQSTLGSKVDKIYVTEAIENKDEVSKKQGKYIKQADTQTFQLSLSQGVTPELVSSVASHIGASPMAAKSLKDTLSGLYGIFLSKEALSLEIHSMVQTADGAFVCSESSFTFDDAARKRQPELFALEDIENEVPEELESQEYGLVYIKMNGNIGNVVNGAGLAMATNDAIAAAGGASANFLDAGGQATKKTMQKAFEIILRDECVEVILVNIYGGIIKCDMIAESIIGAAQELGPLKIPLVVRLQGTNSAEGLKILDDANLGFHVESDFGKAAETAVELALKQE